MENGEIPLKEATAEQMVAELARRGVSHMLAVETVEPGVGGQVQAQIFVRACPHKAVALLMQLRKLVEGLT